MTIPICDCMCDACLDDECTACTYITHEPSFREVHPITNAEDEATLIANCPDCTALIMHTHERTTP